MIGVKCGGSWLGVRDLLLTIHVSGGVSGRADVTRFLLNSYSGKECLKKTLASDFGFDLGTNRLDHGDILKNIHESFGHEFWRSTEQGAHRRGAD